MLHSYLQSGSSDEQQQCSAYVYGLRVQIQAQGNLAFVLCIPPLQEGDYARQSAFKQLENRLVKEFGAKKVSAYSLNESPPSVMIVKNATPQEVKEYIRLPAALKNELSRENQALYIVRAGLDEPALPAGAASLPSLEPAAQESIVKALRPIITEYLGNIGHVDIERIRYEEHTRRKLDEAVRGLVYEETLPKAWVLPLLQGMQRYCENEKTYDTALPLPALNARNR